jgi:hypothetical protein
MSDTQPDFLARIERETKGLQGDDLARYLGQHVGIGIAFMRGALGEKFTREFIVAAFTAADTNGTESFTKGNRRIVLPREPNQN